MEAELYGHAQLKKVYEMKHAEMNPRLFVHAHVVELLGEKLATGSCYVELNCVRQTCRAKGNSETLL